MSFNRQDYAPDVPYLPGTRVCLNPDAPNYRTYNETQAKGDAGYIVKLDLDATTFHNWRTYSPSTRAGVDTVVRWDNGHQNVYHFYDLLPVEATPIDVVHIVTRDGNSYYGPPEDTWKRADADVIKHGGKVRSVRVFDEEWRKKILDSML